MGKGPTVYQPLWVSERHLSRTLETWRLWSRAEGVYWRSFPELAAAPADSLIKVAWLGNLPRSNLVFGTWCPKTQEGYAVRDVLMLLAVILSIPFVILAFGLPIALVAQLFLWIGRLF